MIKSCFDEQKWAARREIKSDRMIWMCGVSYVDMNLVVLEPTKPTLPLAGAPEERYTLFSPILSILFFFTIVL
jgi:hypothetical protein